MSSNKTRSGKAIIKAANEMCDRVWYNRHMVRREKIKSGECWLVEDGDSARLGYVNAIDRSIWNGALAAAEKMRENYGTENLGPYDTWEWGAVNGKLSALRWVMGDEWDNLNT